MSNNAPKSAVELAMERLRAKDAEAKEGAEGPATLTDDQKQAIAAARRDYDAKLAEAEILFGASLATTFDPEARRQLEANHRRDLGQFISTRDKKIDAIRKGGAS
ncbi:MAG: hypothetical protein VYE68_06325 [Acidobacteriota bacterium]|nr:hypothetical protein [Acidobacteriota bacterium]